MTRLFDTIAMLDWSASAAPGPKTARKDNIFVAVARGGRVGAPDYHRTRADAMAALTALAKAEVNAGRRLLIGCDFAFGYPAGTASALAGAPGAAAMWALLAGMVRDGPDNGSNRFEVAAALNARLPGGGPFWGLPPGRDIPGLTAAKPPRHDAHPPERRAADTAQRGAQPVWKLYTTGAVGSQALLGIPAIRALSMAEGLAGCVGVWPFDSGFAVPDAPVAVAEIYPSMIDPAIRAGRGVGEILDAAQVRIMAGAFAQLDAAGDLAPLFGPPEGVAPGALADAAAEEGWILGLERPMPAPKMMSRDAARAVAAPRLTAAAHAVAGVRPEPAMTQIALIGINEDGLPGLSPAARARLKAAEVILGGDRHPDLGVRGERLAWPGDFAGTVALVRAQAGRRVAVLAHGDPLWFSIGAKLARALGPDVLEVFPNLSTFQLVAARLRWSMADLETLSCHRGEPSSVLPYLYPRARLLILSTGADTPGNIARLLTAQGWGDSRLSLFSAVGGAQEERVDAVAASFPATDLAFTLLAVDCVPGAGAVIRPMGTAAPGMAGGLPQQVRAAILTDLAPFRGATLAALGQGARAVAADWTWAARDTTSAANEAPPDQIALGLRMPPRPLGQGATPDAVFLGPTALTAIPLAIDTAARPGRLVVCVPADGPDAAGLEAAHAAHGGALRRLSVDERTADGWRDGPAHLLWTLALR
jgi:precorrin-6Y C5,15-methyltransferase (decarboxylating)